MGKFLLIQLFAIFLIFNNSMSEIKFLESIFTKDTDQNKQA